MDGGELVGEWGLGQRRGGDSGEQLSAAGHTVGLLRDKPGSSEGRSCERIDELTEAASSDR